MEQGEVKKLIDRLTKDNAHLKSDQLELQKTVSNLQAENLTLRSDLTSLRDIVYESQRNIHLLTEQYRTTTDRIEQLKKDNTNNNNVPTSTASVVKRSIPAPSKVLIDEQKKKDNRLLELRRITQHVMQVSEDEAKLRLHKLQKTMIHVVADLKKLMRQKKEATNKSWKAIDVNTQRVAFELVEREATAIGVPLTMCIGYWGARRLISKSWANALRTTKKQGKMKPNAEDNSQAEDEDEEMKIEEIKDTRSGE
ncbi:uncharacterized protein B0P05DRAFT_638536 [Gilbertella persicaria]|uniref:uncharacterized protein n=1 Tax=Gilbertella persicaria TaxID=101096 RepID=UPI0022201B5A|nr:uncharacterized protein B0P05DRAFT_638536 [Gilbertella persicaria]KAI8075946.1 hypothetical protein B0P05DRAFT_638536 [Gilbertella persicaria]